MERSSLTRYAWLSIAAAVTTIALKAGAYLLTGSVGLLSDAIESLINLVAAGMALGMLTIAARPPDESHLYGHGKAEYFSSIVEGMLILVAAAGIAYTAIQRLALAAGRTGKTPKPTTTIASKPPRTTRAKPCPLHALLACFLLLEDFLENLVKPIINVTSESHVGHI
jgi:divalent metal cation (Fe/Co/Zn/Cd) transporter